MTGHASTSNYCVAIAVVFLAVSLAGSVRAQSVPRGWVGVNFGSSPSAGKHFSIVANSTRSCCGAVVTTRDLRSDLELRAGRAIDIDAGLFLTRFVGVRAGLTSVSRVGPVSLSIQEGNMWGSPGVSGTGVFSPARDFRRDEDSFDVGPVAMFPITTRIQGRAFGGPTYVRIAQELMTNVNIIYEGDEGFRPYWERPFTIPVRDVRYDVEKVDAAAWGYHAGAGVTVLVSRDIHVGATVRYTAAEADLDTNLDPNYVSQPAIKRVRTGGWYFLGGSSLRF